MTTYELLTIHSSLLTDQQFQEQLGRVKDVITRNGGQVGKEDIWGRRRLAYPIRKQREGYYSVLLFDLESTGSCLDELERFCKIEETVLRHLVTRAVLDKSLGAPPATQSSDDSSDRDARSAKASSEAQEKDSAEETEETEETDEPVEDIDAEDDDSDSEDKS